MPIFLADKQMAGLTITIRAVLGSPTLRTFGQARVASVAAVRAERPAMRSTLLFLFRWHWQPALRVQTNASKQQHSAKLRKPESLPWSNRLGRNVGSVTGRGSARVGRSMPAARVVHCAHVRTGCSGIGIIVAILPKF